MAFTDEQNDQIKLVAMLLVDCKEILEQATGKAKEGSHDWAAIDDLREMIDDVWETIADRYVELPDDD